jgi:hypothetical protein
MDRVIRLWDIEPSGNDAARVLRGHTDVILSIAYSPDGRLLLSSGFDQQVMVWDTDDGHLLYAFPDRVTRTISLAYHPGGQPVIGENLRMTEIAGAILDCQLAKLSQILDRIERNTGVIRRELEQVDGLHLRPAAPERDPHALGVVFYMPSAEKADIITRALQAEGVSASKIYGGQPVYTARQIPQSVDHC